MQPVGCQTYDQEVVGSTGRGRSLHNDSEQVVHTHMHLPSNSINWYWRKRGKTGTPSEATRYPWSHDISMYFYG